MTGAMNENVVKHDYRDTVIKKLQKPKLKKEMAYQKLCKQGVMI